MQISGIAGDASIDRLKGTSGFSESVFDEHQFGNENPRHRVNPPKAMWLPGRYGSWKHMRLDFAW
jgi:hypothetical protein